MDIGASRIDTDIYAWNVIENSYLNSNVPMFDVDFRWVMASLYGNLNNEVAERDRDLEKMLEGFRQQMDKKAQVLLNISETFKPSYWDMAGCEERQGLCESVVPGLEADVETLKRLAEIPDAAAQLGEQERSC